MSRAPRWFWRARAHALRTGRLLVCCLCASAATHTVRAELPPGEPTRSASEPPLLVRLAPTAEQLHRERTRALEQDLVRLVSQLPGVERAAVVLDRPLPSEQQLDRPLPPTRVTAVISSRSPRQIGASIERIVSAVLPELALRDLSVIEAPHTAATVADAGAEGALSLVQIGPFRVDPGSASALRGGLAVLLGTNALLAAILLWRTRLIRPRTDRRTES